MIKNQIKIVTMIGDSISMVRPEAGISLLELYTYKLQEKLGGGYYVVARNRRANNTNIQCDPQNIQDDILYNHSRYIVVHLGIVDCAPRLMTRKEELLLRLFHFDWLTNFYIGFKSKHRRFFTKLFPWQRVTKEGFRKNLLTLVNLIREKQSSCLKQVFIINIADTNEINKLRSYNYEKNILEYNEVILSVIRENQDLCLLIDMHKESRENKGILLDDGFHFSIAGHELLANNLYNAILRCE